MSQPLSPKEIDVQTMRAIVFSDHAEVRHAFEQALGPDVEEAIRSLSQSFTDFQDLQALVNPDERAANVQMFLHAALNSLISALHLLISGFMAPAGNMMRQFGEATAMALLCVERTNGTYERYQQLGDQFPFHKAVDRVAREDVRKALGVSQRDWQSFSRATAFYGRFSHASDFALATHMMFDRPGIVILAGEYDPGKREIYRIEIRKMRQAADALAEAMEIVRSHSTRT